MIMVGRDFLAAEAHPMQKFPHTHQFPFQSKGGP
jgi:hypothetical protein